MGRREEEKNENKFRLFTLRVFVFLPGDLGPKKRKCFESWLKLAIEFSSATFMCEKQYIRRIFWISWPLDSQTLASVVLGEDSLGSSRLLVHVQQGTNSSNGKVVDKLHYPPEPVPGKALTMRRCNASIDWTGRMDILYFVQCSIAMHLYR